MRRAALPCRERQKNQHGQGSVLGHGSQVHQDGRTVHPQVVQEPHRDHGSGGHPADLHRRQRNESAKILGEDGGNGSQRRGPDHGEFGPAEQECRHRPERLQDVGEDTSRSRKRSRQLGQGERAEECDDPAEHPGQKDRPRRLKPLSHARGHPEDATADGGADEHRDGAPEAQMAG